MTEWGKRRGGRWALSAALVAAVAFSAVPTASAVTYEPTPTFCREATIRDYLAPLRRLPRLHSPPPSGRIGFGPTSLILTPRSPLLVGGGEIGYFISLAHEASPVSLRWNVTTTISRVDWKGRVEETLSQSRQRVSRIARNQRASVKFEVDHDPAVYRVTVVVQNWGGRKLGGYGLYFRVVRPTRDASLRLNAASFHIGQSVFGQLENRGTETVLYGAAYRIERLDGTTWVRAPESPRAFVAIGLYALPGRSGDCSSFWIPPTMPSGHYRMVKGVKFAIPELRADGPERTLYAEFDVLP